MVQKKEFMLVFRYEPSPDYQPNQAEINVMHQQWGTYIGNIAIQEKLISSHQLGLQGKQILPDKSVVDGTYIVNNQTLGGNMIVRASTLDEAVEIAMDCPILVMGEQ